MQGRKKVLKSSGEFKTVKPQFTAALFLVAATQGGESRSGNRDGFCQKEILILRFP
jgi:hypothetical protein